MDLGVNPLIKELGGDSEVCMVYEEVFFPAIIVP